MAAASYTTDLTDITSSFTTGWNLITEGGGGQNAITAPETDDFVQGTESVSRNPFSSSIRGIMYDNGSTVTVASGEAVFFWWKADVAQALDTKAGGGVRLAMGSGLTAYRQYYVAGSDTYTYGGWRCVPIDPTNAGDLDRGTPGNPPYQYYGVAFDVPATGPSKGFPFKIDMVRHGRLLIVTDGDLANGYATFAGAGTTNNTISNQWGLFQDVGGSYLHQGLFQMGTGATAVDFRDANRVINIADTEFVGTGFNGYEINNASSNVEWTNINISALGTNARGNFVINNNATVSWDGCAFTDVGTFSLGGTNTTVDGCTFRATDQITLNGSDLINSRIENNRAASSVLASDLATITGNTFVSDGSNHAVELDSIGTGTMTWDNVAINYATGTAGSPVTPTSTGNETIYVNANSSSDLTINVSPGATTPSIRVGASFTGNVNVVSTFTLTLTGVPSGNQVTIVNSTTRAERQNTNPTTGADITYSHSGGETVDILVVGLNIDPNSASIYDLTLDNANQTIPINTSEERNYSNPA